MAKTVENQEQIDDVYESSSAAHGADYEEA